MPSQDRAVQNQASCRTGHLRRAIWYDGSSTVQFAVTDNILIQKLLKVLPVPICEQAKSSSACLPPLEWLYRRNVCLTARSLSPPACEVAVISGLPKISRRSHWGVHRRRNVRSPAATARALRGVHERLSSRPTVAGVITRNVQATADSDMIGAVRTRPLSAHAGF